MNKILLLVCALTSCHHWAWLVEEGGQSVVNGSLLGDFQSDD